MLLTKLGLFFFVLGLTAWPVSYFLLMRREDVRRYEAETAPPRGYMARIRSLRRARAGFSEATRRWILAEDVLSYSYWTAVLLLVAAMLIK